MSQSRCGGMADAIDSKSIAQKACGFDSLHRHQTLSNDHLISMLQKAEHNAYTRQQACERTFTVLHFVSSFPQYAIMINGPWESVRRMPNSGCTGGTEEDANGVAWVRTRSWEGQVG